MSLLVQSSEAWRATPGSASVFYSDEPTYIDAMSLGPFAPVEATLTVWKHTISDTDGCWDLHDPTPARPMQALMDHDVPLYVVLKELTIRKWTSINGAVVHEIVNGVHALQYDRRKIMSKRSYLQVALKSRWMKGGAPQTRIGFISLRSFVVVICFDLFRFA